MILPGILVILTPLVIGMLFGQEALAGYLAGVIVSGVQMAISAANTTDFQLYFYLKIWCLSNYLDIFVQT